MRFPNFTFSKKIPFWRLFTQVCVFKYSLLDLETVNLQTFAVSMHIGGIHGDDVDV